MPPCHQPAFSCPGGPGRGGLAPEASPQAAPPHHLSWDLVPHPWPWGLGPQGPGLELGPGAFCLCAFLGLRCCTAGGLALLLPCLRPGRHFTAWEEELPGSEMSLPAGELSWEEGHRPGARLHCGARGLVQARGVGRAGGGAVHDCSSMLGASSKLGTDRGRVSSPFPPLPAPAPAWPVPSSCFQTNPDTSLQGHLREERAADCLVACGRAS